MHLSKKTIAFEDPLFVLHYSVFERCLGLWDVEGRLTDPAYLIFQKSFTDSFLDGNQQLYRLIASAETLEAVKLSPFGNSYQSKAVLNRTVYPFSEPFACDHHRSSIKLASELSWKGCDVFIIVDDASIEPMKKLFDENSSKFKLITPKDAFTLMSSSKKEE